MNDIATVLLLLFAHGTEADINDKDSHTILAHYPTPSVEACMHTYKKIEEQFYNDFGRHDLYGFCIVIPKGEKDHQMNYKGHQDAISVVPVGVVPEGILREPEGGLK